MNQDAQSPWYKQVWLWFVLAPLIAVVLYTPVFIYLAVSTSDGIVKDNYYKVARGYNVDTSLEDKAATLGINGQLLIDSQTGDLRLNMNTSATLPEQLSLSIIHPTHQQYDQQITLKKLAGTALYSGSLTGTLQGKRFLILEPQDQSWQIRREILPPYDQRTFDIGVNGH